MNIRDKIYKKVLEEKLNLLEDLIDKVEKLREKKMTYDKIAELVGENKSNLINYVHWNKLPSLQKLKALLDKFN